MVAAMAKAADVHHARRVDVADRRGRAALRQTAASTACRCARSTGRPASATRRRCSTTSVTARACCGRSWPSTADRSTPGATPCSTSTRPTASPTSGGWRRRSCCRSSPSCTIRAGATTSRIAAELVNRDNREIEPGEPSILADPVGRDPRDSITRWRRLVAPMLPPLVVGPPLHRRYAAMRFAHIELGRRANESGHRTGAAVHQPPRRPRHVDPRPPPLSAETAAMVEERTTSAAVSVVSCSSVGCVDRASRSAWRPTAASNTLRTKRALPKPRVARLGVDHLGEPQRAAPRRGGSWLVLAHRLEDRDQLVGRVVGEVDRAREAALQAGVGVDQRRPSPPGSRRR